jgi:hypothetical protein
LECAKCRSYNLCGKRISTSKFIVNNHPLDKTKDNTKQQTIVYVMESDDKVIGGYSLPDYNEIHYGGVYTLDGKTLEELTGMSDYPEWLEQWQEKYK